MNKKTPLWKMIGYTKSVALLLILLSGYKTEALAQLPGMGFSFSRVILMQDDKGASVSVRNNSDNVYLMQSQIYSADGATGFPAISTNKAQPLFMVLPPLKRVEPHSELALRILATPKASQQLPKDRESVFFISVKAIPAISADEQNNEKNSGRVMLALVNSIKLFYRPHGLEKQAVNNIANKLVFSRQGKKLHVRNPSPYYATFSSLSVGGKAVKDQELLAMVPPMGEQTYLLPEDIAGGEVSWRLIDEYGLYTDEQHTPMR
jgi:fimbrial chaperone protein